LNIVHKKEKIQDLLPLQQNLNPLPLQRLQTLHQFKIAAFAADFKFALQLHMHFPQTCCTCSDVLKSS
jgi:hypothetical protein